MTHSWPAWALLAVPRFIFKRFCAGVHNEALCACEPWSESPSLSVCRYPAPVSTSEPLFAAPLAVQRHTLVADLLAEQGLTELPDLGCGTGKLLDFLLTHRGELGTPAWLCTAAA